MAKHIVVIANGHMSDYKRFAAVLASADVIIAADGGLNHLKKMDIAPTLMLGDFDSIDSLDDFRKYFPKAEVHSFEVRKDYTDSELAIRTAIEYQATKITLLAVTGSRLDHSLANIMLLKLIYDAGIIGELINEDNVIRYTEKTIDLIGEVGSNMSIVPVGEEVSGITLSGFEYPLEDATLAFGSTTGISNVFAKERATVAIKSGKALVFQSRD